MTQLSLYTIPPDRPFADTLAKGLLAQAGNDPMALAQMRLLLPTRRAIRSVREAFLRLSGGRPMLLPHMQPLGDVDDEEMLLSGMLPASHAEAGLLPAMPSSKRILLLAQLVWRYHQLEYGPSARMEQAVQLARELASLLDEIDRHELDARDLKRIVPENMAEHWQLTLDFLGIIIHEWPKILHQQGAMDPVARRNMLLLQLAQHWQRHPPPYPVIAAGTTGSTPATARLLKVIAGLPNGSVVLPGWDVEMPEQVWDALDETHPLFGMKQLLQQSFGVGRDAVRLYGEAANAGLAAGDASSTTPRVALMHEALRPAVVSDSWSAVQLDMAAALQGCARIDCATSQEEATTIALLLREVLDTPGKTAALVTPNRDLARRVAAVLRRFHVEIDDSAGVALSDTPLGMLMRLVNDVAINRGAPVPLLSLLKHPLVQLGLPKGQCRRLARRLEQAILRGIRLANGIVSFKDELMLLEKLSTEQRDELILFVERIDNILSPYLELTAQHNVELSILLRTHIAVAEQLSASEDGSICLWSGGEAEQFSALLHELLASAEEMEPVDATSYAGIFSALLAGRVWRPHYGTHPRLHILSPMEARLQLFDRVVLGGLNEGGWPMDVGQDPWMSRPMRRQFGLPVPERQIGLSAHDFLVLACAPEVYFTRADKEGGSPTVPSRWLLRLDALLGEGEWRQVWMESAAHWRHWASQLDVPMQVLPCMPPAPCPPLLARPRELYVTNIETLLRNPYGIYARKILKLHPLAPLDQEPGAADFGNLVHESIEAYVKSGAQGIESLRESGGKIFVPYMNRPGIAAFWWPRFLRIAEWFIAEESQRMPLLRAVQAESRGEISWQAPAGEFVLRARIDRVEIYKDGGVRIIDYKTGMLPTNKDVEAGIASQLLLEAVMAQEGTIGRAALRGTSLTDVEYWSLKGGKEAGKVHCYAERAVKSGGLEQWIENAWQGVQALIAQYDDPSMPYLYVPVESRKPRFDDYQHLARVQEWRAET